MAELHPGLGPLGRLSQGPLGRAHAPCGDHQALLDEPLAGELVAGADATEHLLGPDPDVMEAEDRVLEHEGVHVARRPLQDHTRGVLVHEKQRGLALGRTFAMTMKKSATSPTVTNHFSPFSR